MFVANFRKVYKNVRATRNQHRLDSISFCFVKDGNLHNLLRAVDGHMFDGVDAQYISRLRTHSESQRTFVGSRQVEILEKYFMRRLEFV